MKKTWLAASVVVIAACGTVRNGGSADLVELNRVELARCAHAGTGAPFTEQFVSELAGTYELFLFDADGEASASGALELVPNSAPGANADPLVGPPPLLAGSTAIDGASIGATFAGDAASTAPDAPGVGLYRFAEDDVRLRLGAEANRRDRTRFDGAHTTLTVTSVADDRFGGTWTSSVDAEEANGTFCARRAAP